MPVDPARLNIVFIHCDSMDGRFLGGMGHPAMANATPHLDALARRGVLFRNAYCNNPICCPSRASMWSGQFTHHGEGWNNHKGLAEDAPTFQTHLEAAGYRTRILGKTDYLSGQHTIRARVSPWTRSARIMRPNYTLAAPRIIEEHGERLHEADWRDAERAAEWLRKEAGRGGRPFFLYLGLRAPHPPFVTTRRWLERIPESKVDVPARDELDHPVLQYQRINKNWQHGFSDELLRRLRRVYCAMIAEVDAMAGVVLDALEALGQNESTCVIFSSDHGELAGEHRQFQKMSPYEASARVPLIVSGPGIRRGETSEALVSLVDIHPTLMDWAGIRPPQGLDGHSLRPELAGEASGRPDWVLCEFHGTTCSTGMFMLRRGAWKYIAYVGEAPLLFNLEDDPDERRNVAPSRPGVVAELDAQLRRIVDYEALDAKVKAYDKRSFRRWRGEQLAAGTYRDTMARIFSGWSRRPEDAIRPWTPEDEHRIEAWLGVG